MAVRISTACRNAMVTAAKALIDAGSGAGKVRVYTGTQPAGPGTSATGTLLVEIALADPATGSASSGSAAGDVDPIPTGVAVADGTAGYIRVLDSDNVAIIDAAVTGGEAVVTPGTITTGVTVSLTSLTLTQPAS